MRYTILLLLLNKKNMEWPQIEPAIYDFLSRAFFSKKAKVLFMSSTVLHFDACSSSTMLFGIPKRCIPNSQGVSGPFLRSLQLRNSHGGWGSLQPRSFDLCRSHGSVEEMDVWHEGVQRSYNMPPVQVCGFGRQFSHPWWFLCISHARVVCHRPHVSSCKVTGNRTAQ